MIKGVSRAVRAIDKIIVTGTFSKENNKLFEYNKPEMPDLRSTKLEICHESFIHRWA